MAKLGINLHSYAQYIYVMQGLYQGGQCNPNAIGATSNHFKRAMNVIAVGGQNPERVIEHAQKGVNFEGDIQAREMMFKAMGEQWGQAKNQLLQQQSQMAQMMDNSFRTAMLEQQRMQAMHHESWMRSQEHLRMQQQMLQKQFQGIKLAQQAQQWTNEAVMEMAHDAAKETYAAEQSNILSSSTSMLETMMSDPDPRFQNSQFLHFLKRIRQGELVIEGKQLREVKPDTKLMDQNWNQAEATEKTMSQDWDRASKIHESNMATLEGRYSEAQQKEYLQGLYSQKEFEENWQARLDQYEKEYADHENFESMLQEKYMQVLKEMNLDLTEAWQSATDLEEELVHGDIRNEYLFNKNNPYLDVAFPKKLALELINEGKNNEAILALEAHLQRKKQDADTWRILGRILQENDQDQQSIPCFMNCLNNEPNNLDCLLSLGVSCTNILDEVKAMNYLKRWLMLNPKYQMQGIDNIIPDDKINQPTYKIEQIKQINAQLISVFEQAAKQHPDDPQLLTALAILFFVKREYEVSIDLFNRALTLEPTNYLLMNKVGATLAHLGRTDQAISFYHRALDIRPNYVRVWVNIGIAHAFKGLYSQAARFYLNALSFRPNAKHVWSYLHTCFMSMGRYDLISQISKQDPYSFGEFEVINLNQLPQPQIDYKITTQRHILHRQATRWLDEFEGK